LHFECALCTGEFIFALESSSGTGASDLCDLGRLRRLLQGWTHTGIGGDSSSSSSSTSSSSSSSHGHDHANSQLPALVLLNICHSECAADVFINAGVTHVVACHAKQRIRCRPGTTVLSQRVMEGQS
jgi:hypothetical protein